MRRKWLKLWVDMPTDPKFRVIAKLAQQHLTSVIAVYVFMLVDASSSGEDGKTHATDETIAAALDLETEQVFDIRKAMQGMVLDGDYLTGWEKRQNSKLKKILRKRKSLRPSAEVWRSIRTYIFGRDDYTCQYCGERGKKLECDHVIPISRGGSNEESNLVTACFSCNRSKRDKLVSEWRGA